MTQPPELPRSTGRHANGSRQTFPSSHERAPGDDAGLRAQTSAQTDEGRTASAQRTGSAPQTGHGSSPGGAASPQGAVPPAPSGPAPTGQHPTAPMPSQPHSAQQPVPSGAEAPSGPDRTAEAGANRPAPGMPEAGQAGAGRTSSPETGHPAAAQANGPSPAGGPAQPGGPHPGAAQGFAAAAEPPRSGDPHGGGAIPPGGAVPPGGTFGDPQAGPPAGPPQGRRRGPGWGGVVGIAAIAALLGGVLGGGGALLAGGLDLTGSSAAPQSQSDEPKSSQPLHDTTETPDWASIADSVSPGVAAIQVGVNGEVSGLGSGFVYDDSGHIVTNNHVVAPADTDGGEIQVIFSDGSTVDARLVGRDPETDVAVLELATVPDDVAPLDRGASEDLRVGDPVMALGNPLGLADTVTTGIVSALDRPVTTQNIGDLSEQEATTTITSAIQTDAAINPGNSGGPLVDGNGRLVGINSSAATMSAPGSEEQSGSIGIGFAIPVEQAVSIADQLIQTGRATHPFLGVTMRDSTVELGGVTRSSAQVQEVASGSPAEAAGFEQGDEIIAVGGKPVSSGVSMQALVRSSTPGEPIEMSVVRGGQEQTLTVTLEAN
jgi:putative serine protease PepD